MSSEYFSERLTPHPLPTKDGGVLRTVGDARAYILALPKTRMARAHWKRASLLLQEEVGAAALTRQVQAALVWPTHVPRALDWLLHIRFGAKRVPLGARGTVLGGTTTRHERGFAG